MTEAEAIEAIDARWKASWDATQPTVPYAFGNEAMPTTGIASFVSVTFGPIASKQITQGATGNRIFERRGVLNVKLFGAVDVGDAPLALLMASVRTALEAQELGGSAGVQPVQTYAVSDGAPTKQGSWYTRMAMVPFCFYERR